MSIIRNPAVGHYELLFYSKVKFCFEALPSPQFKHSTLTNIFQTGILRTQ